ncbi:MAG: hypothetical protein ACXAC2_00325 [Candidatus Kariarchaeaceae archaeon]
MKWNQEWGADSNNSIQEHIGKLSTKDIGDYLLYLVYTWIEGNKERDVIVNKPEAQIKLIMALRELKHIEYKQFADGDFLAGLGVLAMNDLAILVAKKWGISKEELEIYNPIAKKGD